MPRRVEDIVRTDRRSIRNIPASRSSERESKKPYSNKISASETESEKIPIHKIKISQNVPAEKINGPRKTKYKKGGKLIWFSIIVAVVLVVGLTAYVVSTNFSRATFSVVPVTIPLDVNNMTIVATGTSSPGYLRYEIVKHTSTASTTLTATDGPFISTKASGTVIIYNAFSPQAQRLIAGTRLASDSGLVYRLPSSIVIPRSSTTSAGLVPGSIKTTVVADKAGAEYNLSKSSGTGELRIIAYQGGPRYETIYAKTQTDIAGGFEGTKKTINQKLLASTTKDLEIALTKSLRESAKMSVPDGYVTYENAYSTTFAAPIIGGTITGKAAVGVNGTLYSIIFKKTDLVAKLAGKTKLSTFGSSAFNAVGLESLKFTITNADTFRPAKLNTLITRFSGNLTLTGIVPVDEIRHKLAGLSISDTRAIFASYSSVIDSNKSLGELYPSWITSVPRDESRITVTVKN